MRRFSKIVERFSKRKQNKVFRKHFYESGDFAAKKGDFNGVISIFRVKKLNLPHIMEGIGKKVFQNERKVFKKKTKQGIWKTTGKPSGLQRA